jgi:hypothetical protein
LLNFDQWRTYTKTLKGHPLYRLFGEWNVSVREGDERAASDRKQHARRAEYMQWAVNRRRASVAQRKRQAALDRVNVAKQAQSREQLERLLGNARPIWDDAVRRGQRLGWLRLRTLLADAGVEVSEARSKRLVKELGRLHVADDSADRTEN